MIIIIGSQVISTEGQHGSITFANGASYTYTGSSTTTKAFSFLVTLEQES